MFRFVWSERRDTDFLAEEEAVKALRELWATALNLPESSISPETTFFELGGNSLLAIKLTHAINRKFHTAVPTSYLLEHNSLTTFLANLNSHAQRILTIPKLPAKSVSDLQNLEPSLLQEWFWYLQQREPLHTSSNNSEFFRVKPGFSWETFKRALCRTVRRHESLRTLIRQTASGELRIEVAARNPEFEGVQLEKEDASMMKQLVEFHRRPFKLEAEFPIRISLFEREEDQLEIVAVCCHHVVTDIWSRDVFFRDLCAFYKKDAKSLPSLSIQFKDFAAFQRSQIYGQAKHASLNFWKAYLKDYRPLKLPTDHQRPSSSYLDEGISVEFVLEADKSASLRALAKDWNVSLFSLVLGAYYLFLQRITGQNDVTVATSLSNREHFQLENLVGLFANDVPLRQVLDSPASLQSLVRTVSENLRTVKEHGGVPFSRILFEAGISPSENSSAEVWVPAYFQLFESSLELDIPLEPFAPANERVQLAMMNYEMTTWVDAASPSIHVTILGAEGLFIQKSLHALSQVYLSILNEAASLTE